MTLAAVAGPRLAPGRSRPAFAWTWSTSGAAPCRARGLDRWLRGGRPVAARGRGQRRAGQRRARPRAEPRLPRERLRDRRAQLSQLPEPRPIDEPCPPSRPADRSWATSSSPAAWRGARRGRRATPSGPSSGSSRSMACCTCSATITSATTGDGARRAPAPTQGRPARRPDRAGASAPVAVQHRTMIPLLIFLLALRRRLSRRDRSGVQRADAAVAAAGRRAQRPARRARRVSRRSAPAVRPGPAAARPGHRRRHRAAGARRSASRAPTA